MFEDSCPAHGTAGYRQPLHSAHGTGEAARILLAHSWGDKPVSEDARLRIVNPAWCSGDSVTGEPSSCRVLFMVSRAASFLLGEAELSLFAKDHGALEMRWQVVML